jgi:predicted histone-like DNA-binding protein
MAIKFSVHERKNPRDTNAPQKFYPVARSSGYVNLKQISGRIAEMSTVNTGDVLAVLDLLIQVMKSELSRGNTCKLGDFGSFFVKLHTEGSESVQEVNASNVKQARLRFRPGADLNDTLRNLRYEKLPDTPAA